MLRFSTQHTQSKTPCTKQFPSQHPLMILILSAAMLVIILCCLSLNGCASTPQPALTTSHHVNLQKYSGLWYEIASFPNSFQKGCRCTTARYSLENDYVRVINSCFRDNSSKPSVARGKAFVVANSNNSKLKVQFFWPFKGDYWILYHDINYSYAIVGNPKRNYLWILARKPRIPKNTLNLLIKMAKNRHFDTTKLNFTDQRCYLP